MYLITDYMRKSTLKLPIKNEYMGGRGYGELKHMSSMRWRVMVGDGKASAQEGGGRKLSNLAFVLGRKRRQRKEVLK